MKRSKPLRADPEKVREWKQRGRRNNQLKRTRINPVNRGRKERRWDKAFGSEEKVEWLQGHNCLVCGHLPSEVAHVKSRGAGGGHENNLVPLCTEHHREQHDTGIQTFEEKYGLDLTLEAHDYESRWQEVRNGGIDLGF